jgi:hypothetical protein
MFDSNNMKRFWPIWIPYATTGLLIGPACFNTLSGNSIGKPETALWMIRGAIIGPFEGLINPYLIQGQDYPSMVDIFGIFIIAVLCITSIFFYLRHTNKQTAILGFFGTILWIFFGLGAALAWV